MTPSVVAGLVWVVLLGVFLRFAWRHRRRRTHLGPGAIGTLDEFLNEDRRKAIEIIVEQRAEARDPEFAEGNLPELEAPKPDR